MRLPEFDDDLASALDELNSVRLQMEFDDRKVGCSMNFPVLVCYRYLPISGKYSFVDNFDADDARRYFDVMRRLSRASVNDAIDADEDEFRNFHFVRPTPRMRKAIEGFNGCALRNVTLIQFGLYTDKRHMADRSSGVKAPRVFCMVGYGGVIYPVLYDPYHEMYKC